MTVSSRNTASLACEARRRSRADGKKQQQTAVICLYLSNQSERSREGLNRVLHRQMLRTTASWDMRDVSAVGSEVELLDQTLVRWSGKTQIRTYCVMFTQSVNLICMTQPSSGS